jgi:hypothetical protein
MDDFKVPTTQLATEIHCVDGSVLRGRIFMPALSAVHSGPMLPQEWVNSPPLFFPFRQDDGTTILVNKDQVVAMSVAATPEGDDEAREPAAPVRRATVEAGGKRFEGGLAIDMPEHQRRVVDYLNRPEAFLCLISGENHLLIRKALISRVVGTEEK